MGGFVSRAELPELGQPRSRFELCGPVGRLPCGAPVQISDGGHLWTIALLAIGVTALVLLLGTWRECMNRREVKVYVQHYARQQAKYDALREELACEGIRKPFPQKDRRQH